MKILVTGSAGFIGTNLCRYLLKKGYRVVGIDDFDDNYSPKLKRFNISSFQDNSNFLNYKVDITDKEKLREVFKKEKHIDTIVHLAAWAGVTDSIEKPSIYISANISGTDNLAGLSVEYGVKSFVFASTSAIYGDNKPPFEEDMDTSKPFAPYPATKKAGEVFLWTYHKNFGLPVTIFRFFNPLGPYMRLDLALPKLVKSALYDIEFPQYQSLDLTSRDYTYIDNMLKAMEFVVKTPFEYEIMNLGNSSPVGLGELVKSVEKVVGSKVNLVRKPERKGEMKATCANIDKAKNLINYNPQETIDEMVDKYYQWFLKQPEWYKRFG